MRGQQEQTWQGGVEVCPDEGREMRSSALPWQAQRFGRRHGQPPIEFPCGAPQRDGKLPKTAGNPANVGEEDATARFSTFFMVSAVPDPKSNELVASCKRITAELRRLESHRVDLPLVGSSDKERPESSFRPKDGE
jgi:hypothetical protein